ncbi:MAG: hypothetical protein ACI8PZ_004274 [Myxococcota bacterium]|jgi:hypothetical protein
MYRIVVLAALAAPGVASAGSLLTGDLIQVAYDDEGQWGFLDTGFQVWDDEWLDATWPGTPWNLIVVAWDAPDPMSLSVNQGDDDVFHSAADLSVDSVNEASHAWGTDDLMVEKTETWDDASSTLVVSYRVENLGMAPISNVRLSHGVDWDVDYTRFFGFTTANDVRDDGWLAIAAGPSSGLSLAMGACDPGTQSVGFSGWDISADPPLTDPDSEEGDTTMHMRYAHPGELEPGEAAEFRFLVIYAASPGAASDAYDAEAPALCERMFLTAPDPGTAGVRNRWQGRGAVPGSRVYMAVGEPGETEIPGCPGSSVGVARPKLLGPVTADGDGNAVFSATVPAPLAGVSYRMQLADPESCTVSNTVDETF